jgi:protein gp37
MGESSAIEWTTATWNPWRGCDKVSPGCAHCYMFRDQQRYGRDPSVVVRAADSTFYAPLRARKWRDLAAGSLVFTCSWSDWFHEDADPWRDEAWGVIRERPDLTWQILTKRPERIADHLPRWWGDADAEAPANVWLGVSIENRRYVHRAEVLRQTPAAVRFISAEPLLGPLLAPVRLLGVPQWMDGHSGPEVDLTGIDWLIVGGESGPKHRAIRAEWVRDLRDRCEADGVAFFFKQWGGPRPTSGGRELDGRRWDEMPILAHDLEGSGAWRVTSRTGRAREAVSQR